MRFPFGLLRLTRPLLLPCYVRTMENVGPHEWMMLWDQSLTDLVSGDGTAEKSPWHAISTRWRELEYPELWRFKTALYVLTISKPFTFAYPKRHSHIFYIGEGIAHDRFKDHIDHKMLPWLKSLTQARFDFHVLPCKDKAEAEASELALLCEFERKFGRKPILNVRNGKRRDCKPHPRWHEPIDLRRHKLRDWSIWPIGRYERPD